MFDILPPELKSLAVRTKVRYVSEICVSLLAQPGSPTFENTVLRH